MVVVVYCSISKGICVKGTHTILGNSNGTQIIHTATIFVEFAYGVFVWGRKFTADLD